MGTRFTHNTTTVAYLVLASTAGGLILGDPVWGAVSASIVTWPLAILLRRLIAGERAETDE